MGISFEAPDNINNSSTFLEHEKANEGKYLLIVNQGYEGERPKKGDMEAIDGFCIDFAINAGPHEGKKYQTTFYLGSNHKDGGEFARKKIAAFAIACDLMKPEQLGKTIDFELSDAVGSIFVADLRLGKGKDADSKGFLEIRDAYHIDDPRAKDFVSKKDFAAELKAIFEGVPKENRHSAEYFASLIQKPEKPSGNSRVTDDDLEDL